MLSNILRSTLRGLSLEDLFRQLPKASRGEGAFTTNDRTTDLSKHLRQIEPSTGVLSNQV
jgi:hypothetical protein